MGRVINVLKLSGLTLSLPRPSNEPQLGFSALIRDPLCPWQDNKTFQFSLDSSSGELRVAGIEGESASGQRVDCELSICGLAGLVYGIFSDVNELRLRDWVAGASQETLKTIGQMFPPTQCPYFYQMF